MNTTASLAPSLGVPPRRPELPLGARLPGLDGLRALAVLAVIVYHFAPDALPGGFIGVDIFFVISGFLITTLLASEHAATGRIRLGEFWRRRARRLLPALALLLLSCAAAALVVGGNVLVNLGAQLLGASTFSSNWVSIAQGSSYFGESSPELFRNLWSLAVEEQFYLAWPLIVLALLVIRAPAARVTAVTAIAVASAVAMMSLFTPGADATRVYYGTDTHSFGLALGAVWAFVRANAGPRRPLPRVVETVVQPVVAVVALAGLAWMAAAFTATDPFVYRGGLLLVAIASLVVIIDATRPGSVLAGLLETRAMLWIGERSYGLYLWHWPVFVLVVGALPALERTGVNTWLLAAIASAITLVAAEVSHRFVETPIRRHGFRAMGRHAVTALRGSPLRIAGGVLAAAVVLASVGMAAVGITLDPGQSDAEARISAGQRALEDAERSPQTKPPAAPPESPEPVTGDDIIALGDSVMLAAAPQLQKQFPGIAIDATVSRQMRQAPGILKKLETKGRLRPIVVIGLGTNGPIGRDTLEEILQIVGPKRTIVLVNTQAPRGWVRGVNADLRWFAERYRDVELANWHDAIAPHLDVLARDQVHPGPTGGRIYSTAIATALKHHAALRPAIDPSQRGLAPRPV